MAWPEPGENQSLCGREGHIESQQPGFLIHRYVGEKGGVQDVETHFLGECATENVLVPKRGG